MNIIRYRVTETDFTIIVNNRGDKFRNARYEITASPLIVRYLRRRVYVCYIYILVRFVADNDLFLYLFK